MNINYGTVLSIDDLLMLIKDNLFIIHFVKYHGTNLPFTCFTVVCCYMSNVEK